MPASKKFWRAAAMAVVIAAGGGWWYFSSAGNQGPEYIRIGSFNIFEFGREGNVDRRNLGELAKLLVGMDLIAVQEVRNDSSGAKQVYALRDSMNALVQAQGNGKKFKTPLVSEVTGNKERYAFIYRDPVKYISRDLNPGTQKGEWWLQTHMDAQGVHTHNGYNRIPAFMYFRAKKFDFVLATAHLMWTNTGKRTEEVDSLRDWLWSFEARGGEKDCILVGDMNRYGAYSGVDVEDMAFSRFLENGWQDHYRMLFLEPLVSWTRKYADADEQSTTVGKQKNLYDQIIITKNTEHEFGTEPAVYEQTIGVIPFDMLSGFDSISHDSLRRIMSDHRPIWARFRIDLKDDD